jgi:beta-lactam-binding protein with PASTA domain
MNDNDIIYMKRAIELAKLAGELGEVPIGAVVVRDVKIVGEGERVVRQSPAAGERMERDGGVLVVYMGDETESSTVQVPSVLGLSAAAANRVLINAGLNIRITGTKQHLTGSAAQVVRQSPAAGETVDIGTVVTLTFTSANETE